MSTIITSHERAKYIVLFSSKFQKQFSKTRMLQMNLLPVCEYNNIKYFYTNDHNSLYEEEMEGKLLIIEQPISLIKEYIVTEFFIDAIILQATDLHIMHNKIYYRKQGHTLNMVNITNEKVQDIKRFLKVYCDLNIFSNVDESTIIYTIFLNEIISVRVSFFPTAYEPLLSFRFIYSQPIRTHNVALSHIIDNNSLVIIGGVTGMGKTTLMYKMMENYHHTYEDKMIISVEDPVEYIMAGIVQRTVENNDYATVIKSILRHRPDLIIIGELRDRETANALLRALLTGHKVLCTLHISCHHNVWESTLHRMEELGVNSAHFKNYLQCIVMMEKKYEYTIYQKSL